MEKIKKGIQLWITKLKEMWLSLVISCGVWTILVFLWEKGVRGFLFTVLNFFTGALLSVDGENMLGGVIGRTLILMVFNTFISSLLIHKGKFKTRFAFAKEDFKSGLKNLSEYVESFSLFATKEKDIIFAGVLGVGLSIIWNAFITGNGALVNTFSCIALFILLLEQFDTKSGFFVAVVNLLARKLGYKDICGDAVLAFIEAFMAGCLLMPILAFFHLNDAAYAIGSIVASVGAVGLFWSKGMFKSFTAMFLLFLLLVPATRVNAGGMEYITTLKQGSFERTETTGDTVTYTTTVTDVVINGQARTEEEIQLVEGDKCSFVVRTNDPQFIRFADVEKCDTCGVDTLHYFTFPLMDGDYSQYTKEGFSAEFRFEDIEIAWDGTIIGGTLSGDVSAECIYVTNDNNYYYLCPTCDEERFQQNIDHVINNTYGTGNVKIELSNASIGCMFEYTEGTEVFYLHVDAGISEPKVIVTWEGMEKALFNCPEEVLIEFGPDGQVRDIFRGEEEDYIYYPDVEENVSNNDTPDYDTDKQPDYGMSEEEYAEMLERGESVPMNTAVAVVASVAAAGAVATVAAPLTSVVESAAGMKKKKGQLVVNGDADVPTIHYNDHENIMIPVNVTDGDDVVWAITAIAITPDDEKLVKAIAIPTSTTSAEIKLEIQRAPKEKVTTYIEVTTLGVELTGEHYFHEKMVEVNIEP